MATERAVPYDYGAEEAVLGALLLDRDAIVKVAAFLQPEDFHQDKNAWIYAAIVRLYGRREPADMVTVQSELDRSQKLEQIGGTSYLARLLHQVPTSVHVEYYAHIVERSAILRRLISVGGQIASLGYEEAPDLESVLGRAEQLLLGVTKLNRRSEMVPIGEAVMRYVDRLEARTEAGITMPGLSTGIGDLDDISGGLQPGDFWPIAGLTGGGKSTLMAQIALNLALAEQPTGVAIYSLEMSADQQVHRALSNVSRVTGSGLWSGLLRDSEWQAFTRAVGALSASPILLSDGAGMTLRDIEHSLRRVKAEGIKGSNAQVGLAIVDYLQLVKAAGGAPKDTAALDDIAYGLKNLARELQITVMAGSQIANEAVRSNVPPAKWLDYMRGSGAIAHAADISLMVHSPRERPMNPREPVPLDVYVAKARQNATGSLPLWWDLPTFRIGTADQLGVEAYTAGMFGNGI